MTAPDPDAEWQAVWARMPQDQRDTIAAVMEKFASLTGKTPTTPPTAEAMNEALQWQNLEIAILDAHAAWLARMKAMFKRRGWPWTHAELLARAHLREVGE